MLSKMSEEQKADAYRRGHPSSQVHPTALNDEEKHCLAATLTDKAKKGGGGCPFLNSSKDG